MDADTLVSRAGAVETFVSVLRSYSGCGMLPCQAAYWPMNWPDLLVVTNAEAPAGMFGNAQSFAIYIEVNPVLRVASGLSSKDITNALYANGLLTDV